MKFVLPSAAYERQAKDFIQEFYEHDSERHGQAGLDRFLEESSYADWLAHNLKFMDLANVPEGFVPGYTYFYADDNDRIIGIISIRLYLNDFLREQGGHIGYSIRPTERKKGHGTAMLKGALEFLAPLGLNEVLVTCGKENLGSVGVIKNCGGVLEDEIYSEAFGRMTQRYWIHIEKQEQTP